MMRNIEDRPHIGSSPLSREVIGHSSPAIKVAKTIPDNQVSFGVEPFIKEERFRNNWLLLADIG